ncbi:hypothetical protein B0J13DRAFT_530147 [Dactylonectria estremocensis]|uniref:Secreted protein n=1 Tax=Dactylonectria estremocensis TaxID=1079267 RepID=A0A9P9E1J2_9HYPO|nr:hypothetical protein B0J13DRAFT_530147 [Dactylonectria estremocensis]
MSPLLRSPAFILLGMLLPLLLSPHPIVGSSSRALFLVSSPGVSPGPLMTPICRSRAHLTYFIWTESRKGVHSSSRKAGPSTALPDTHAAPVERWSARSFSFVGLVLGNWAYYGELVDARTIAPARTIGHRYLHSAPCTLSYTSIVVLLLHTYTKTCGLM